MENPLLLFSLIIFAPALGALVLAFVPKDKPDIIRLFTLFVTILVLVLTILMAIPGQLPVSFDLSVDTMQGASQVSWIPTFNIDYFLGADGISFPW